MHVRVRFCWPHAAALAPTVCSTTRSPRGGHKHQVAARIQNFSPMPGKCARGEGTSKVSMRQERGYAGGALPTALRVHRVPFTIPSRWRIIRGRRITPTRGCSASSVLPLRSLQGSVQRCAPRTQRRVAGWRSCLRPPRRPRASQCSPGTRRTWRRGGWKRHTSKVVGGARLLRMVARARLAAAAHARAHPVPSQGGKEGGRSLDLEGTKSATRAAGPHRGHLSVGGLLEGGAHLGQVANHRSENGRTQPAAEPRRPRRARGAHQDRARASGSAARREAQQPNQARASLAWTNDMHPAFVRRWPRAAGASDGERWVLYVVGPLYWLQRRFPGQVLSPGS